MKTRALLAACGLLALSSAGCRYRQPTSPDLIERNAVYTVEDGRLVRITAYRGQSPVLGQCVDPLSYGLSAGSCVDPGERPARLPDAILDKQGFRSSSRMVSVETALDVGAGAQRGGVSVSVVRHRLFLEWNRYRVYSLDPYDTQAREPHEPYVSAVEYGIGVRVILEVRLTNVDAQSNLSFGFGDVAAKVATGNAQIDVQYDTIGVAKDILPENLPVAIESVNDITAMMSGLYDAVQDISERWDAEVDARGDNFSVQIADSISAPTAQGSSDPDGTGDMLDAPDRAADTSGEGTTSAPAPSMSGDMEGEPIDELVEDISTARDEFASLRGAERRALDPLLEDDGDPILGGASFDDIEAAVDSDQDLSADQLESLEDSLLSYLEALEELDDRQLAALPAGLAQELRTPQGVRSTYARYYAAPGTTAALFPKGFSAAPIAYYVARSDNEIRRDHCESLRLSYALDRRGVDAADQAECATYWDDNYGPEELLERYCATKLLSWSTRRRLPPKRLRQRCDWELELPEPEPEPAETPAPAEAPEPAASKDAEPATDATEGVTDEDTNDTMSGEGSANIE